MGVERDSVYSNYPLLTDRYDKNLQPSVRSSTYPTRRVRVKKVLGFRTVFSLFRTENGGFFCVFPRFFCHRIKTR
jgi:hypothetical protein